MKLLKRIFDFYIDASIHVALSAFSMFWVSLYFLNISEPVSHLSYFVFFATIPCYNFIKYGVEAKKYLIVATQYHKNIQVLSIIALGIALYHAYFLEQRTLGTLLLLAVCSGLYAIPVLPGARNLRSLGVFKIFIVAGVWAGVTVSVPALEGNIGLTWDVHMETIQRFIMVLVLLIPFEVRDLAYDDLALKTIPQRFGVVFTNFWGGVLTLLFFFMTFLKDHITYIEVIAKGLLFLTLGIILMENKRKQKKYFASFWVESVPIFWAVGIALMEYWY